MKNYKKLKLKLNKALSISILIVFFLNTGFSQNCPFKRDTAFIISINVYKKKYPPLQTGGVTKCFDFINSNNADSIIKHFFQNAIYFTDPMLSITSNIKCFSDTSEAKKSFNYSSQIIMEKWKDTTINIKCKKKTTLQISFSKIIADIWIIPTDFDKINSLSIGYKLNVNNYKHDYYYGLKHLYKVFKLTKEEKLFMQNNTKNKRKSNSDLKKMKN